jgi:hypothetical protein
MVGARASLGANVTLFDGAHHDHFDLKPLAVPTMASVKGMLFAKPATVVFERGVSPTGTPRVRSVPVDEPPVAGGRLRRGERRVVVRLDPTPSRTDVPPAVLADHEHRARGESGDRPVLISTP